MIEQCLNLTSNLSLQRGFKSMQIHVSEASHVKLTNPTQLPPRPDHRRLLGRLKVLVETGSDVVCVECSVFAVILGQVNANSC
jgi:hypothetical protein